MRSKTFDHDDGSFQFTAMDEVTLPKFGASDGMLSALRVRERRGVKQPAAGCVVRMVPYNGGCSRSPRFVPVTLPRVTFIDGPEPMLARERLLAANDNRLQQVAA